MNRSSDLRELLVGEPVSSDEGEESDFNVDHQSDFSDSFTDLSSNSEDDYQPNSDEIDEWSREHNTHLDNELQASCRLTIQTNASPRSFPRPFDIPGPSSRADPQFSDTVPTAHKLSPQSLKSKYLVLLGKIKLVLKNVHREIQNQ
ncbi:hypothetical protein J6590_051742 [Homalodisca vitripennis]|nr:hypothetical protein J6590_051742 [Homalodisca vitripennis]